MQARRKLTGIMNYTNPGAISHNEVLELYKQYIDPEFKWSNFTVEEQAKVIVAPRSNNLLDTTRVRAVSRGKQLRSSPGQCCAGRQAGAACSGRGRGKQSSLPCQTASQHGAYLASTAYDPAVGCAKALTDARNTAQMEKEFPEMLPIKESLIKYVFEPNAANKEETLKKVREMRGR